MQIVTTTKRYLMIVMLLLPLLAMAQSGEVRAFFGRYAEADGVTSMQLEQKMMRMMSRQAAERGDEKLAQLLGDIRYIRIVAVKEGGDGERFVRDAEAAVHADRKFQLLASATEDGQMTKFFLREAALTDHYLRTPGNGRGEYLWGFRFATGRTACVHSAAISGWVRYFRCAPAA